MFKVTARTVLELGSELISSDIIAFYELIKNGFDAGSKKGVEIRFFVPLRRNSFLRLKTQAETGSEVDVLRKNLREMLDPSCPVEAQQPFDEVLAAVSKKKFMSSLTEAYRSANAIIVADQGNGMSLTDLGENYLTIGTPSRKRSVDEAMKEAAETDKDGPPPYLGEKGIGRLSAMRLGERLLLTTARNEDTHLNELNIDWRSFSDLDAMVEDVKIKPNRGDKKTNPNYSGTSLSISDLSEDWTRAKLEELAEHDFARLVDPFGDPKKRPRIALFWNDDRISIPWMDKILLKNSHATVEAEYRITKAGPELKYRMEARSLGFDHPKEIDEGTLSLPDLEGSIIGKDDVHPLEALTSLGPFRFAAHWYNRRRLGGVEGLGDQKRVRELQRRWSGIMMFRDGFRVFPYGDDDDDWLGLDRRALGSPGYLLNKTQFVGHVRISRLRNPFLLDQTNREGLRATPEQQVLVGILQHIIQGLFRGFLREMDRRYKRQPLDLSSVETEIANLETRAKIALKQIRQHVPREDEELYVDLQQAFFEFKELTERAQKRIKEVEEDSRQMTQMAGVGLMVEVVAHELARSSESALKTLEALKSQKLPEPARAHFETLRAEMKSVSKRLRVLDPLSVSGRQRSEVFDLGHLIDELEEGHRSQFDRHKVVFKFDRPEKPLRIRAVKGMIVQVLENLISNSIYWMDIKSKRESGFVPQIKIELEADPLLITYRDNGSGIALENAEKVFQPFWSLKEKTKRRGLGLFIARECVEYHQGTLKLETSDISKAKRLNKFVIELPESARA